jgi:hypothetical protein
MPGTITISTLSDGANSTSATNCIKGSAKAWVNFNGGYLNTAGAINGSYNVSSVTVNGTGQYTVNMTTAMPSANYSALATSSNAPGSVYANLSNSALTDSSFSIWTIQPSSVVNTSFISAAVFI